MSDISTEAQQVNNQAGSALKNTETALLTVNQTIQGINAIRETISETEKRIKRLGERSQEITGVVNLINSIAERTHILALNASMHAASAGEAGRGFAVVADEVQRLAENAREATTEIGTLVSNIKAETADTVTAMNNAITQVAQGTQMAEQAGLAMKNTQKSTEELVHSVEHIAVSSLEQSRATTELVERANEIVKGTRQTDKYLKIQNVSTAQLADYSSQLVATVSVFKLPESSLQRNSIAVPELQQVIESQDSDIVRKKAWSS
jgi:methyl-accepting chemotaxis protein